MRKYSHGSCLYVLALNFFTNGMEKLMEEREEVKKSNISKNTKREPSMGWVSVGSNS